MTQVNFCANDFAPFSRRILEVLGRLQAHTISMATSSVYIYDLVEQRTLCTSYPVAAMLGYTADEIDAMGPTGLASLIHPDDLDRVSMHYQRFTTLLYGKIITTEYRMKRADGTWCQLRSQETPLVQAIDGFPLQILGVLQMMTSPANRFGRSPLLSQPFKRRRLSQSVRISSRRRKQQFSSKIN